MPRHKSTHIGICISDGSPASSGPLQDLHTFKMTSSMPSPYRSHASHHGGQHVDGAPHPGCGSSSRGSRRGQRALFKWRLECRRWIAHHLGLRHLGYIATASCPVLSPFGSTRQLHRLLPASWALPRSPSGCRRQCQPIPWACALAWAPAAWAA